MPIALGAKERQNDERVTISSIIGEVAGRDIIILDDEIARGTTIIELLDRLRERGARTVRVACTHGAVLRRRAGADRGPARGRPRSSAPTPCRCPATASEPKLTVISLAPALAEAIRRIHEGESVSALFGPH